MREELGGKLSGLVDPRHDRVAVNKAFISRKCYVGPYTNDAPDIIVGYSEGYRVSWETTVGDITDEVFSDNLKAWSADHCVDPRIVPGVLFCNREIEDEAPRMMDLAPTVLELFGVKTPKYMDGRPLVVADA